MAQVQRAADWIKPGSKLEILYNWLKREIVGEESEILFTRTSAEELMPLLNVNTKEDVWNMLGRLEAKKLIIKKRKAGEKGLTISFVKKEAAEASEAEPANVAKTTGRRDGGKAVARKSGGRQYGKSQLTVAALLKKLRSEIVELNAQKGTLDEQIARKTALIEELTQASRR